MVSKIRRHFDLRCFITMESIVYSYDIALKTMDWRMNLALFYFVDIRSGC